jgi:hypothetical protein
MISSAPAAKALPCPGNGPHANRGQRGFRVVPFPSARRAILDYLAVARRKHVVHALVEVDVTLPRRALCEHRARTGASLSFTAYVYRGLRSHSTGDTTGRDPYANRIVIEETVTVK